MGRLVKTAEIMSTVAAYAHLLPPLGDMVRGWIHEDIPSFDYGGAVVGEADETATLYCKSKGVLAGVPFFNAIFAEVGCTVEWSATEGEHIDPGVGGKVAIATVKGKARHLLIGERTALNVICRSSGIASKAARLVAIKTETKWHGAVAGTRKTTPGFRLVEKHAMLVGGADMHRVDLSSMVMLKDNHIWSHGSITNAVKQARAVCGFALKIEVECGTPEEAEEAIAAGADIVMLDNFEPADLAVAAGRLKEAHPHVIIEGSGGITEESIGSYMCPGVDVLSTSSIHQGTAHIDFSLKITKKE